MGACNKAYTGVGNTAHEYLGAGAIYFNWGLDDETCIGVTKGGSEFSDNAEFREREADGDYAPVKGHRDMIKIMPQLTVNALKLNTTNLIKFMAGNKTDYSTVGKVKIHRTLDLSESYITNVAWVGASREGRYMVIVLKNVLSDSVFSLSATKDEEIVNNVQFTAHIDDSFCPDDYTTYPYYVEKDSSQVTFVVDNGTTPIEGAEVVVDGQYLVTDVAGTVITDIDKANKLLVTVMADNYTTSKAYVAITEDTETCNITLTAV